MNQRTTNTHDQVLLKFMEKTIDNINTLLAGQYTLYKLLIEKNIVSEKELLSMLRDSKNLPDRKRGAEALEEMLNPNWEDQVNLQNTDKVLVNQTLDKIYRISIPQQWADEGIYSPNSTAIRNAMNICIKVFDTWRMLPDQIAPSKENGVFFMYRYGHRNSIIESYNDGKVAALVVDEVKSETVYSEDIKDLDLKNCFNLLISKDTI